MAAAPNCDFLCYGAVYKRTHLQYTYLASVTITIESSTNGATTLSRMNLSGYV